MIFQWMCFLFFQLVHLASVEAEELFVKRV